MKIALIAVDNVASRTFQYILECPLSCGKYKSFGSLTKDELMSIPKNAYINVMQTILRDKGYRIEFYAKRQHIDRYGTITQQWLDKNGFYFDDLHIIDPSYDICTDFNDPIYLIDVDHSLAHRMYKKGILTSASIITCPINTQAKLNNKMFRVYL